MGLAIVLLCIFLGLPSCGPGFESETHLRMPWFFEIIFVINLWSRYRLQLMSFLGDLVFEFWHKGNRKKIRFRNLTFQWFTQRGISDAWKIDAFSTAHQNLKEYEKLNLINNCSFLYLIIIRMHFPLYYYCLRPKAKDLGITWVVVVRVRIRDPQGKLNLWSGIFSNYKLTL